LTNFNEIYYNTTFKILSTVISKKDLLNRGGVDGQDSK